MPLTIELGGTHQKTFSQQVEDRSGEDLSACYQCGKCTAGCPLAFAMDLDPARVVRLIQLGQQAAVLQSHTIWLCASCEACTTRCPQEVDLARIMDALRSLAREAGYTRAEREIALFNENFLGNLFTRGRVHETRLVMQHSLLSGHPFRDVDKAPLMLARGKFSLRGEKTGALAAIQRLFQRAAQQRDQQA